MSLVKVIVPPCEPWIRRVLAVQCCLIQIVRWHRIKGKIVRALDNFALASDLCDVLFFFHASQSFIHMARSFAQILQDLYVKILFHILRTLCWCSRRADDFVFFCSKH